MYSSRSSPTAYQPLSFFYINWNTQGFPFHFLKKKTFFLKLEENCFINVVLVYAIQQHESVIIICIYICIFICVCVSCSVMSDSLWPHELQPARLPCPWHSPGKNTRVDCHYLLQRIFLIQGLKYIPSFLSLPLLTPSHLSRSSQSTRLGPLCYIASSRYFTHDTICMSMLLSQFVPPSPSPLCPQTCSWHLSPFSPYK